MSQSSWTYYDPSYGTQTVGVYHGDDSGHLVVYCNNKVVMIDFKVKTNKSYSFYINDCLIELKLMKKDESFDHDFKTTLENAGIETYTTLSAPRVFFYCTLVLLAIVSLINILIFTFFY